MSSFKAFAPGVEVNGETVLSVLDGMGAFKTMGLKILADNGIVNPVPGQWYSQQAWLDSFKAISQKLGPSTLRAIGKSIPANAQWPPEVKTIQAALSSIDIAYHMNHRGGEIGHYTFKAGNDNGGTLVANNPYPSDFDLGIIQAVAQKFAPAGTRPAVSLDTAAPTRLNGADSCTYTIGW